MRMPRQRARPPTAPAIMSYWSRTVFVILALLAAFIGLSAFVYLACKSGAALVGFVLLLGWLAVATAIAAIAHHAGQLGDKHPPDRDSTAADGHWAAWRQI